MHVGDLATLRRLLALEARTNANGRDAKGCTALMYSSRVPPAAPADGGAAPPAGASAVDRATAIDLLIDGGEDVDSVDDSGWTALMWAAFRGDVEIVRHLVACGADALIASSVDSGSTPKGSSPRFFAEFGLPGLPRILQARR